MVENRVSTECAQFSSIKEGDKFLLRELIIQREGRSYLISVSTTGYLQSVQEHNRALDDESGIDENIYVVGSVENLDEVCQELGQKLFEELEPYLTELQL